ncbi:uncharacterized protein LOC116187111 isoform X2 [Punica granatum]|uniref:Uncharacterized protein LOC116187111 isoform X2 n=1 Tax=Punica granatum TaxID=22663 RepID=A0A6P8BP09_PUNGR|nr:uncharacterized protein LOC116187111 isoform X2 [Punica granatum]
MAMTQPIGGLGIELLNQSNYKVWRSCMESYLVGEDLWDVVDGNNIISPEPEATAVKKWKRLNAKAEFALKRLLNKGNEAPENQLADPTLTQAREEDPLRHYRPLHKAALNGDWEAADSIFKSDPEALTAKITSMGETALHVAADVGRTEFIEKLVALMTPEALEIQEHERSQTALHYAVARGSLHIVKTLVAKNGRLMEMADRWEYTPLHLAAYYFESKEIVWYLVLKMPDVPLPYTASPFFAGSAASQLIDKLVASRSYDICLHLLDQYPFLATVTTVNEAGMLSGLAHRPSEFPSGSKLGFCGRCIYRIIPVESHHKPRNSSPKSDLEDQRAEEPPTLLQSATSYLNQVMQWINGASWTAIEHLVPGIKHIKDQKFKHKCIQKMVEIACQQMSCWNEKDVLSYFAKVGFFYIAAQNGGVELITTCLQYFPYLMRNNTIRLQAAVLHRQEKVFNLFLGGAVTTKYLAATFDAQTQENILHKVARLAPYPRLSSVSCPALQMQRELQWFKAVEKLLNPTQRTIKNKKWETAREIFTTEHRDLLRDAERWMKDTSNSCMVVSTLIATVVFAAAFTVPGGNVEDQGIPLFLKEKVFILFVVSDALGLFSSTTSVLMFLSILTARYAEEDFLRPLPKRLILGFASLFLAIACMMVAFGATLYMVLSERFKWIFIPIIAITSIPVILFVMLQLPLFIYMVQSTYGSGIFHPKRIW